MLHCLYRTDPELRRHPALRRLREYVGKVKKAGAVTKRHLKSSTSKRGTRGSKARAPSVARKAVRGKRGTASKRPKGRRNAVPKAPSRAPTFHVRELDPLQKCGSGTSVERLYRVDEASGEPRGTTRPHLVFLDRHGWYCEDGRDCPAVAHARKHDERARHRPPKHPSNHTGPNHNGRTRA